MMLTREISMQYRVKMISGEAYISQREAAKRLGVCQATMSRIVERGSVTTSRVDGVRSVWVRESDLVRLRKGLDYGQRD